MEENCGTLQELTGSSGRITFFVDKRGTFLSIADSWEVCQKLGGFGGSWRHLDGVQLGLSRLDRFGGLATTSAGSFGICRHLEVIFEKLQKIAESCGTVQAVELTIISMR